MVLQCDSCKLAFTRPKAGREVAPLNGTQEHKNDGPTWKATGHAQARMRLARAAVILPPSAPASSRTGTSCHCAGQPALPVGTVSKWAVLHRFLKFYTLRVEIFRMFLILSSLPMTPMNREKFHGNRSARFSEIRNTHTATATATLYI